MVGFLQLVSEVLNTIRKMDSLGPAAAMVLDWLCFGVLGVFTGVSVCLELVLNLFLNRNKQTPTHLKISPSLLWVFFVPNPSKIVVRRLVFGVLSLFFFMGSIHFNFHKNRFL